MLKSPIKMALSAAVLATGFALPAAVPANAQVVLQFGEQPTTYGIDRQDARRANRIENRGDRKAARAAANGNYERAARIDQRSENRADNVRRQGTYATSPEPLIQFRID